MRETDLIKTTVIIAKKKSKARKMAVIYPLVRLYSYAWMSKDRANLSWHQKSTEPFTPRRLHSMCKRRYI